MNEISFVPDYGFRGLLEKAVAFIVMPIYLIIGFVLLINHGDLASLLNGQGLLSILYEVGIPVIFMLFICYQRPKEIALSQSQVIIRKYIFPEQRLGLHELTAIDNEEVRFEKRKIDLKVMKNGNDLSAIIRKVIDEGMPQLNQDVEKAPDEKSQREQVVGYAVAFTILFLIVWYGIWYLFINDFKYFINPALLGGITFFVAYLGVSLFLKNKNK